MSVRKRTWRNKDGTQSEAWVVTYTGDDGKRHLKTFHQQRDAQRCQNNIRRLRGNLIWWPMQGSMEEEQLVEKLTAAIDAANDLIFHLRGLRDEGRLAMRRRPTLPGGVKIANG
jgi:hypothetical protein